MRRVHRTREVTYALGIKRQIFTTSAVDCAERDYGTPNGILRTVVTARAAVPPRRLELPPQLVDRCLDTR